MPETFLELVGRHLHQKDRKIFFVIVAILIGCFCFPLVITIVGLVAYWLGSPAIVKEANHFLHDTLGPLGELYIVWHSLFDTLAFLAIFLTLYVQMKDISERNKQFDVQQFQSVLFPGLTLFQTYLDNLQHGSLR